MKRRGSRENPCHHLDLRDQAAHDAIMLIYKILTAAQWTELQDKVATTGAPIDVADGYVHFSTAEQCPETVAKYFADQTGLMLLAYDSAVLGDMIKWEPSRDGALFPHLYDHLRLDQMIWAKPLPWNGETHDFPADMI